MSALEEEQAQDCIENHVGEVVTPRLTAVNRMIEGKAGGRERQVLGTHGAAIDEGVKKQR